MSPSIAILIPTKNRSNLLRRAITSVLSQTVLPDEFIIVNDGSTDDTDQFLKEISGEYGWIKIINCIESRGVNAARNLGISHASSEWIAFLDDDDEFLENAIEVIKNKIEQDKGVDVLYFNTKIIRDEGGFVGGFQFGRFDTRIDYFDPSYKQTMVKFNLLGDCKQIIKRVLFTSNKYFFPESVNGFESYTMSLMARDGVRIRYYKEVLTILHQESTVNSRLSLNASKKNPWPLLLLHLKQILQHIKFYLLEPYILTNKIVTILKLSIRALLLKLDKLARN